MVTDITYNATQYGTSIEGFLNWTNASVEGWFANLFLAFIFIATFYTLSKSEWKMNSCITFAFLFTFIISMIINLIMGVSSYITFVLVAGTVVSIIVQVMSGRR